MLGIQLNASLTSARQVFYYGAMPTASDLFVSKHLVIYHKPRNHGKDDSEEFLTLVDTTEQNQKELLPWLDLCDNLVRLCSMTTSLGVDMITTGQP